MLPRKPDSQSIAWRIACSSSIDVNGFHRTRTAPHSMARW